LAALARALLMHGTIRTTVAKAKETQRLVDRLITLGKEGSVHARRQAYRVLQDRELVKRLFAEVAPQCLTAQGGYTRVLKLHSRLGDGAPQALLELTHLPATVPKAAPPKAKTAPPTPSAPPPAPPEAQAPTVGKGLLKGLREWLRPKKREWDS
jgi:large subunit ribosomal protein L17